MGEATVKGPTEQESEGRKAEGSVANNYASQANFFYGILAGINMSAGVDLVGVVGGGELKVELADGTTVGAPISRDQVLELPVLAVWVREAILPYSSASQGLPESL